MIDPHIQGLLTAMAESGFQLPDPITPQSLRAALDNPIPGAPVEIAEQRDLSIDTGDRLIRGRVYHPSPGEKLPVVLYFHGGGWVHGTLDMFDRLCATLAVQAQCAFLSVDYRLAPEHPFPAAWNDAVKSLHWVKEKQKDLSVDASRIVLAGDSSGGNLAAAAAQAAAGDPAIVHQLLLYPAIGGRCNSQSFDAGHGGFLSAEQMRWYWEQYAPGESRNDPRASPILGSISASTAPATIIVAGNDPLYDDGVAYAAALNNASVACALHDFPGAIHGFVSLFGLVPVSDEAIKIAVNALRDAFTPQ